MGIGIFIGYNRKRGDIFYRIYLIIVHLHNLDPAQHGCCSAGRAVYRVSTMAAATAQGSSSLGLPRILCGLI